VIATTSSGRRFAALARYLLHGRSGDETERVAWTAGRNLGLDDPELAAAIMQATANANPQVEVPVYHLTINFDPADAVTPEHMQAVADRVLADLGLTEHQAFMVAHRDRAHPHVHIMVNRVHPDTGIAWDRWKDRPRIERTLRELERELGSARWQVGSTKWTGRSLRNARRSQAANVGRPSAPGIPRSPTASARTCPSCAQPDRGTSWRPHSLDMDSGSSGRARGS